jgi:hypothetical protein
MKQWFSRIISLLVILISLHPAHAQSDTVITQCDFQHVNKAIAKGGSILLDCDRVIQIWVNKPLTIVADTAIKPADGRKVTFEALKGRAFVVNAGMTLTLDNMTVRGNPNAIGGGIENNGGKLVVTNVEFGDNDESGGAALHNHEGGSASIIDSYFAGNTTFGGGGAIYNDAKADMSISRTGFVNNHSFSDSNGGAIYNLGTMTIGDSTFSENEAQGRFGWGGAILNTGEGILTVANSTFAQNTAGHSGAAIRNDNKGQTTITFSTFVDNTTQVWGGALHIEGGSMSVSNSLFSHNIAGKSESDCDNHLKLGTITFDHNLSNAGCGDNAATGIATLASNGGLTQTVALASDSNAIDAASECPTSGTDQRGTARPQGKGCDIGAYEYEELATAATSVAICQVTTTRDVRLREEPNTASKVLVVVTHSLTFQAIEQVTGWYHITYGEVNGWISADFVTKKGTCGG